MATFVPLVLNALTLISIFMIVGLGLAIIFGLMNVINLAHGEFVTIGAFTLSFVQAMGGNYIIARISASSGTSVLLVEQNIDLALETSGWCLVMEKGRIVHEGAPDDLRDEAVLSKYLAI